MGDGVGKRLVPGQYFGEFLFGKNSNKMLFSRNPHRSPMVDRATPSQDCRAARHESPEVHRRRQPTLVRKSPADSVVSGPTTWIGLERVQRSHCVQRVGRGWPLTAGRPAAASTAGSPPMNKAHRSTKHTALETEFYHV